MENDISLLIFSKVTSMKIVMKQVREETNLKVKQAYLDLHTKSYFKDDVQGLEEPSSNKTYYAESEVGKTRRHVRVLAVEYYCPVCGR